MRKLGWLFVAALVAALGVGCGDDDGDAMPQADTGPTPPPPPPGDGGMTDSGGGGGSCPGDIGMGACCATASNASRQDAPEMRIVGINITAPSALANATIIGLVQGAIDGQRFHWLMQLGDAGDDGPFTIRTGAGSRNMDGSYAFDTMYPPQMFSGMLMGEGWSTAAAAMTVTIPVLNDDGSLLTALPLEALQVDTATLSEMRDCIGARAGRRWTYGMPESELNAYITVGAAKMVQIEALGMDLCSLLAGTACTMPQAMWRNQPDGECSGGACMASSSCTAGDGCAYALTAQFAAAAVEIQ